MVRTFVGAALVEIELFDGVLVGLELGLGSFSGRERASGCGWLARLRVGRVRANRLLRGAWSLRNDLAGEGAGAVLRETWDTGSQSQSDQNQGFHAGSIIDSPALRKLCLWTHCFTSEGLILPKK